MQAALCGHPALCLSIHQASLAQYPRALLTQYPRLHASEAAMHPGALFLLSLIILPGTQSFALPFLTSEVSALKPVNLLSLSHVFTTN